MRIPSWLRPLPSTRSRVSQAGMQRLPRSSSKTCSPRRGCLVQRGQFSSTRICPMTTTTLVEGSNQNMFIHLIRSSHPSTQSSPSCLGTCWNSSGVLRMCEWRILLSVPFLVGICCATSFSTGGTERRGSDMHERLQPQISSFGPFDN